MPSEIVIQLQQAHGRFTCEAFSGVPISTAAYIGICHARNNASRDIAARFKAALVNELQRIFPASARATPRCHGRAAPFMHCWAANDASNIRILFVVSDGIGTQFYARCLQWGYTVIPVLPAGTLVNLPAPFARPESAFWHHNPGEVLPVLWSKLGISDRSNRVFISYKRTEIAPMAEQLFTELSKDNFDVFLDRFSIEPGTDFQNRLFQELSDKAVVVILESDNYLSSDWVKLEVAFARKYRLGLVAINIKGAPTVKAVHDNDRLKLVAADVTGTGELADDALHHVKQHIKHAHAVALFRKRHYMQSNVRYFLRRRGIHSAINSAGIVTASANGNEFKIATLPRPPETEEYQLLDIQANGANQIKAMVGPPFSEGQRSTLNNWLAGKANTYYFRESQVMELANRIHGGIM